MGYPSQIIWVIGYSWLLTTAFCLRFEVLNPKKHEKEKERQMRKADFLKPIWWHLEQEGGQGRPAWGLKLVAWKATQWI